MTRASDLLTGDILIYNSGHTAMVVRPGIMAHAPGTGAILVHHEITEPSERGELTAFRLKEGSGSVGKIAAAFATRWSKPATSSPSSSLSSSMSSSSSSMAPTPYGEDRARALKRLQAAGKLAGKRHFMEPFGFDALYRAVKWANRAVNQAKPFSEKHGTTCCAFVTACYQAAFVTNLAKGDEFNIKLAYDFLSGERVDKRSEISKLTRKNTKVTVHNTGGTAYQEAGGFHIQVSNVGSKIDLFTIEDWIDLVLYALADIEPREGVVVTAADIFTPALAYDAKFYYTADLLNNLKATTSGWNAIPIDV